jgi:hypothetical protein
MSIPSPTQLTILLRPDNEEHALYLIDESFAGRGLTVIDRHEEVVITLMQGELSLQDRYQLAVDTGTLHYFYNDLWREAVHLNEKEKCIVSRARLLYGIGQHPRWKPKKQEEVAEAIEEASVDTDTLGVPISTLTEQS